MDSGGQKEPSVCLHSRITQHHFRGTAITPGLHTSEGTHTHEETIGRSRFYLIDGCQYILSVEANHISIHIVCMCAYTKVHACLRVDQACTLCWDYIRHCKQREVRDQQSNTEEVTEHG